MMQKMRQIMPIIIVLFLAVIIVVMLRAGERDNPNEIVLVGNIEANEAMLSFQVSGIVTARLVDEGERVTAGQVVARLDTQELESQVAVSRAMLESAEAQLATLTAGTRPEKISQFAAQVSQARARVDMLENGARPQEIEQAANAVDQAKASHARAVIAADLSATEFERMTKLYDAGVIPAQKIDAVKGAYDAALTGVETARMGVENAEEMLSLVNEGARTEEIAAARGALTLAGAAYSEALNGPTVQTIAQAESQVDVARQALAQVETRLSFSELASPLDGTVLTKAVEPGEYVHPGSAIIGISDLSEVWLRVYLSELDLGRVELGMQVDVTTDSFPGKVYEGRVSFISSESEFTPKSVETREERSKLVYRMKITLDNEKGELRTGMPASALIRLEAK